jgi:hypothetical protein
MTDAGKRWLIFGGIAVVGLIIAVIAINATSASPRKFIRDNYACDVDPTQRDNATCTTSGSPGDIADTIASDTRPIDQGVHDDIEFLQYEDDIVAVTSDGSGSRITVDDYETGYRHYSSHFVFFGWSSYRPSGGSGYGGGYGGGGK